MTLTLLMDLDDTLLDTNLDSFLPGYFKKLAMNTANLIPPDVFVREMLRSTQIMYDNKNASKTLEQVFNENFYPAIGVDKETLAKTIDKFYDEVFPTLGVLTKQRPDAIKFVEWAFSKGWKVAIATDPLFPRKAILHRLRWAGLAPEDYPFTLISDFQSFHYAKKSVAFFPEFLAQMNWSNAPILMIGDSLERDIEPSQRTGIPVFWLNKNLVDGGNNIPGGWFPDLINYIEQTDPSTLKLNSKSPAGLSAFLEATPAVMHTLMRKMPSSMWTLQPKIGDWSFLEILCHLRDVDSEVNLNRIKRVLNELDPIIDGQETDGWSVERMYNQQDPMSAFSAFVSVRSNIVRLLSNLSLNEWKRTARHTILGPTNLQELVEIMVDHDRLHIKQVFDLVR